MIGMQYRITLPSDYDMDIIRNRVRENGYKTDGFQDLLFKCYLIQEKDVDGFENVYAPLYVWKANDGMNRFIFDGFFDNIIKSFGWKSIQVGVPLIVDLHGAYKESGYILEITKDITPSESLKNFKNSMELPSGEDQNYRGMVCIYHPDQWKYSQFLFYKERPKMQGSNIYQILHISEG